MTEEQNFDTKEEKCNCICHSKGFRKFIIVALGTFVGAYCALALFAALHRPPMPPCPCCPQMMCPQLNQPNPFMNNERNRMDKQIIKHEMGKKFQPRFEGPVEK